MFIASKKWFWLWFLNIVLPEFCRNSDIYHFVLWPVLPQEGHRMPKRKIFDHHRSCRARSATEHDTFSLQSRLFRYHEKVLPRSYLVSVPTNLINNLLQGDSQKNQLMRTVVDPDIELAPSPSILKSFKKAAVSSDSVVCSEIGRYSTRSCILGMRAVF